MKGFPNVILESQTLNKYVISTDCPTGPKRNFNERNDWKLI